MGKGATLTETLDETGIYPPSVVAMVERAERWGSLERAFHLIARGISRGAFE